MKAMHLRVEYLTDPIGIDFIRPRLSWTCENGVKQTAYRIVAKSDGGKLLWDSGRVESDRMHLVEWGGSALASRTAVVWTVTLWDENGTPQTSEAASFEIGLVSAGDWTAKWITGNYRPEKKKRYPADCFRKTFLISPDRRVMKARAYMTACGVYEGRLNGRRIGRFVLAPGITDYRKRVQYQTADVTELLQEGENSLRFMLADGWYRGSVGAWGMKNYYGSETKLLAQLEITYDDGTTDVVATDGTFEWSDAGPVRFADNKDGEIYDARMEIPEASSWKKAKCSSHAVIPSASDNFPLTEQEYFTNPELIITPSGKKVLDFRQNIAGIVSFHLEAKAGQRIFLRFGELLKDGEFTQKNIQCVRKHYRTPLQQVEYFCKDGVNEYRTAFAIFGFQYIEAEADFDINPADFTAISVYSDFETTFRFESSNELLNRFVANTLWSLKNNSADLPTDCPTRERHGWTGDAQLFLNTASYMVNYAPFALKFENDLCDWQGEDGNFPQIAPEGGTDSYMRGMNGSVGWSDAGVLIPYRLWKKYGDRKIIEKYYDNMKRYAEYMISRTGKSSFIISEKTGLSRADTKYLYNTGQHYGEWAEPADVHAMSYRDFMTSRPEEATAYLFYIMDIMAEIAGALGREQDVPRYEEYRDGAKAAYRKLRKLKKYTLDTDRQARLVRPLYFGLFDEEDAAFARKRLVQALEHYRWRVGTGFLSTPFILYVLGDIDAELAYRLLENEEKPGWLCMPKAGATTIWEDWDGPDSDNGKGGGIASLNHYSKGAVCEWVFEKMCGVKVDGENHFTLAPVPGGHFTHAGLSYDSVYGTVRCAWKKNADGSFSYDVTVPANTTARFLSGGRTEELLPGRHHIDV
ncbi:family 78 glycoside hydrolase catalytic domain [Lachnoclostridium sp. Marseille-P6806]|uniref:family 78 glycoside hydrolase catalytic domain n=1 Tax=Lachnoclostridium sp. Marseille-P6806 TaxID=2364793 RepID=UPI0010301A67|nr:family 78 glycoside hydrolase catalytic domain [Lachnoclostridium sp. Marseille-P6806]